MARSQEDRSQRGDESRTSRGSREDTNLDDRSIDELRQMAGELNIEGRNRLDRDQLIQRIQNERKQEERSQGGPSKQSGVATGYGTSGSKRDQENVPQTESGREGGRRGPSEERGKRQERE